MIDFVLSSSHTGFEPATGGRFDIALSICDML